MKYITPIKFPKFNLELPKQQIKKVVYTDPSSILHTLGVPKFDYFDLQCLKALIKPQQFLEIHKDLDHLGLRTGQHRKPIHHPGRLVIHAPRIRPMRNAAHAAATRGP